MSTLLCLAEQEVEDENTSQLHIILGGVIGALLVVSSVWIGLRCRKNCSAKEDESAYEAGESPSLVNFRLYYPDYGVIIALFCIICVCFLGQIVGSNYSNGRTDTR